MSRHAARPLCTRQGGEALVKSITDGVVPPAVPVAPFNRVPVLKWDRRVDRQNDKTLQCDPVYDDPEMVTVEINLDPINTDPIRASGGNGSQTFLDPFTNDTIESYLLPTDTVEGIKARVEWSVSNADGTAAEGDWAIVDIDQGVVLTVPADFVEVFAISTPPGAQYHGTVQGGTFATVPTVRVRALVAFGSKAYGVSHTARLTVPIPASIGAGAQASPVIAIPRHAVAAVILAHDPTVLAAAHFNQLVNPAPNLSVTPVVVSVAPGANRPVGTDEATFPIVNGAKYFTVDIGGGAFEIGTLRVVFYLSI